MTSPRDRIKSLGAHLWSYRNSIIWLLIIVALAAFTALPLIAQKGYMDEKALVVGAMGLSIHEIQGADSIYNDLKKETDLHDLHHLFNRASELAMKHNPSLPSPPPFFNQNISTISSATSACRAAHAVIPSERGDGTEALLLAFPITPGTDTAALTVAIGVQAARHLSAVSWLAKDLLIVFLEVESTNNSDSGTHCSYSALDALENWLRDVDFEEKKMNKHVEAQPTKTRGFGLIQQGIILDIRTVAATEARLSVHGYNGQLPNLDLVVLTKKNLDFYTNLPHGVGIDVGDAPSVKTSKDMNTLRQRIRTAASFAGYLALGKPTGAHAALLQRGTDSLSITFTRPELSRSSSNNNSNNLSNKDRTKDSDITLTAKNALNAVEMIIRTCNNLHERLHHANALYVLIDADHFVNVGACMGPLGILLAALLLIVGEYLPQISIESEKEKKGAVIAVMVHAIGIGIFLAMQQSCSFNFGNSSINIAIPSLDAILNGENSKLLAQLISTVVAVVLVSLKIKHLGTHHLVPSENKSTSTRTMSNRPPVLSTFVGVCSILVLIEAAALLLWRWALSFALLAITVPFLQLFSQVFR